MPDGSDSVYRLGMLLQLALMLAPAAPKFPLTVESIMRGPALVGHAPRDLHWSSDGSELRFSWAKADGTADPEYKDYMVKRDGTGLASAGTRPFAEKEIEIPSTVEGKTVYLSDGDIFLRDPATKMPQRLTHTTDAKDDPKVSFRWFRRRVTSRAET